MPSSLPTRTRRYCAARAQIYHALVNWKRLLLMHLEAHVEAVMESTSRILSPQRIKEKVVSRTCERLHRMHETLCGIADKYRSDEDRSRTETYKGDELANILHKCCYALGRDLGNVGG